ncbi:helix-turn-helix transcriptional regulator [Kutzneria sp. NPDC051319]|uniref:helix-turn-helix domain-containing protein n=1 Tax=Kutzneria sp. NPDC051319 TaxID=3155047 RepID=UPI003414D96B
MREALAARNIGAVMRAFRTHPHHPALISQETAALWVGLTQSQLCRTENNPRIVDLDKLVRWARVLRIPRDLLWFPMPEDLTEPDDERLVDECLADSNAAAQDPATDRGWSQMSPLTRRALLTRGAVAAALPVLSLDEAQHVAAALDAARRYLDGSVVEYFRRQLDKCKTDDGDQGPADTLPTVLTIVNAIDRHAREVKPDVRRELLRLGAEGAEFAGWLYRDVRDPVLATFWRDRATEWAQVSGDLAMQGYVLLKKAQAAYDERDGAAMLSLAEAAQSSTWHLPPRVRADAAQQEARGYAMTGGDDDLVQRKLDEAHELLANAGDDGHALGAHYNQDLLTMQTALCHTEAGQPRRAAELYQEWLSAKSFSPRDYGYFLSHMASSLALAGEPDAASATGLKSVALARKTKSTRTIEELNGVVARLDRWRGRTAVRDLREALRV